MYVEPNYTCDAVATPTDPMFSDLWGLHNEGQTGGTEDADIDAPEAWELSTGSRDVVVGCDWTRASITPIRISLRICGRTLARCRTTV